jgi:hypothetical protein
MSNTYNTRPYKVQAADPSTKRIGDLLLTGGLRGANGRAKAARKEVNTKRRARDRQVLHEAKYAREADVKPIRADRRSFGYFD